MKRNNKFDIDRALALSPSSTSMLQWKTELRAFCEFMLANGVRSFLEVGSGSGQLSLFLKRALQFDRVYACDLYRSPLLEAQPAIRFYHGDHHDPAYLRWRERAGLIDMVLIDADHHTGFRTDYAIERRFPHRFIAFHDVANRHYPDLCAFWEAEVEGRKELFVNTDPDIEFGVPPLQYPYGPWKSRRQYERRYGRCCGIGVSWNPEPGGSKAVSGLSRLYRDGTRRA